MTSIYKAKLSAITAAILLSACGGGGSDTTQTEVPTSPPTTQPDPTAHVVSVIDGYLANAVVYADRNGDGIANDDEQLGVTNINGQIEVPETDLEFPLIAKIIAGETSDADQVGNVNMSYVMVAAPGSSVITPFTTLAVESDQSLEELAAELNLPSALVAGDYVAEKSNDGMAADAIKAHAVARSFANEIALLKESGSSHIAALKDKSDALITALDEIINEQGIDGIENITVRVDEAGATKVYTNTAELGDYLLSQDKWSIASAKVTTVEYEGVQTVAFDGSKITLFDASGNERFDSNYTVDGIKLIVDGESGDNFILVASEFAVTQPGGEDEMFFFSSVPLDQPSEYVATSVNDFENTTWYVIFDDSSNSSPDVSMAGLSFGPLNSQGQGVVTIAEGSESFDAAYHFDSQLSAIIMESDEFKQPIQYQFVTGTASEKIALERNRGNFNLLVRDKLLAQKIVSNF